MTQKTEENKQSKMSVSFRRDERFLDEWIRRLAKETNTTKANLVKRTMMRDYQRIEVNKGQLNYPITTTKIERIRK